MTFTLEDPLQADARVLGVLDDDDASRSSSATVELGRHGRGRRCDRREAKLERRAPPHAITRNLDGTPVQLDYAAREREADAQTASLAVGTLVRLKEQLEHARGRLGIHAD